MRADSTTKKSIRSTRSSMKPLKCLLNGSKRENSQINFQSLNHKENNTTKHLMNSRREDSTLTRRSLTKSYHSSSKKTLNPPRLSSSPSEVASTRKSSLISMKITSQPKLDIGWDVVKTGISSILWAMMERLLM